MLVMLQHLHSTSSSETHSFAHLTATLFDGMTICELNQITHQLKKAGKRKPIKWVAMSHRISDLSQCGGGGSSKLTDNSTTTANRNWYLIIGQAIASD